MLNSMQRTAWIGAVLGLLITLSPAAQAGAPLICRQFDAGTSPLLPWTKDKNGKDSKWNSPAPDYDVDHLTTDMLKLLSPDAPILARMENIRRASLYAVHHESAAAELLTAVLTRALNSAASGKPDPLAYFDAGYLVETYRQAGWMRSEKDRKEVQDINGYAWVRKALALAGSNPEMEYAASLIGLGSPQSEDHLRRAHAGAIPGSLLAKNLGVR